jgi:hypothetical protein
MASRRVLADSVPGHNFPRTSFAAGSQHFLTFGLNGSIVLTMLDGAAMGGSHDDKVLFGSGKSGSD